MKRSVLTFRDISFRQWCFLNYYKEKPTHQQHYWLARWENFQSAIFGLKSEMNHRLVTRTLNPIWESFSAVLKASSLVSNCPTLTR